MLKKNYCKKTKDNKTILQQPKIHPRVLHPNTKLRRLKLHEEKVFKRIDFSYSTITSFFSGNANPSSQPQAKLQREPQECNEQPFISTTISTDSSSNGAVRQSYLNRSSFNPVEVVKIDPKAEYQKQIDAILAIESGIAQLARKLFLVGLITTTIIWTKTRTGDANFCASTKLQIKFIVVII